MNIITAKRVREIAVESHGTEIHRSNIFPAITYYRFFRELVKEIQPELSFELGTAAGGASMHMADGYPEGTVVTVDRGPRKVWKEHLAYVEENYPNWNLWIMDTLEAPPVIREKFGLYKIGLLYVDATHEREQVLKELKKYKALLANGCVVVFDDLYLNPGMEKMWEEVTAVVSDSIRIDMMHPEVGFGALVFKSGDFDNLPEE